MRFDSATVPAAVTPDRSNDDGFLKYLPLSRNSEWEGFKKPGQVRRPARKKFYVQSFREEKQRINTDSLKFFPADLKMNDGIENCHILCGPSDFNFAPDSCSGTVLLL